MMLFPSLFLSVSKSLLGGCQEEPGFVLAEISIWEAALLRCCWMLQAPEQHLAPNKPSNCPNAARHAWKSCCVPIQEELQESDRFSAKNHGRGSSKLKGEGQSNRERH